MSATQLMQSLTVLHLRFRVRALDPISFNPQPGSALRGAFYQVLRANFCSEVSGYSGPDHALYCPVCWLLAQEDAAAGRGKDLPRPLVIEPPLGAGDRQVRYAPDEEFTFGLSLIGQAQNLLPFVIHAVDKMGRAGIGRQRGRFRLCEMREYDPLLDVERTLLEGRVVREPRLIITSDLVQAAAANFAPDTLTLHLLTPLRLTAAGQLVKTPDPIVFLQRLLERCQSLVEHYGLGEPPPRQAWQWSWGELLRSASAVQITHNVTQWVEVHSGSQRQQRYTPISGLVGQATWHGDLRPLLPWLLWGQSLHVGKDAVKGNGWYRLQL